RHRRGGAEGGGPRLRVAPGGGRPGPGETVRARVGAPGGAGKPVAAEVSLSAADEGVLSLIGFRTPDPVATFYAPWGLGVHTTTEYDRLAQLPEPGQERLATGGDRSARLGTLRPRFPSTAYSRPALDTDPHAPLHL